MALDPSERAVLDAVPSGLFLGGAWRPATGGRTLPVEDPSTGEVLTEVADATVDDALAALTCADETRAEMASVAPRERGEILRRAYEELVARADDLALLMTLEMGKPLAEAKAEVLYAADFLHWFAGEATRIGGEWRDHERGTARMLVTRAPVGPCVLITPWNFPLAMGTRKIGPAIAAGCTMVLKPAKQTPLSMLALVDILDRAGAPKGAVNVITSSSSGAVMEPLIRDARTRKLSFTGSTEVGKVLIAQAADQVLRVSMELGGNAPFVVFEDADLDAAVDGAMIAKLRNNGEACTAANRFHVHADIADAFAQRLAERMGTLTVGRGTEAGVGIGPLIDAAQRDIVAELVDDATARGARALCGGAPLDQVGYFYPPTVLVDVPAEARILGEEIFGPVAPITTFTTEDEAVAAANATEYGLVAYVYTRDIERAFRVIDALEVGMVGLNQGLVSNAGAPFGGVKHSGFGREGGREGIAEYLETKYVSVAR